MVNRLKHILEDHSGSNEYNEYYEVEALGDTYVVSLSTALYVERELDRCGEPMWLEFRDLFGARHRIPARCVYRITESTRSAREAKRAFERAQREEERADEDPLQDLK